MNLKEKERRAKLAIRVMAIILAALMVSGAVAGILMYV